MSKVSLSTYTLKTLASFVGIAPENTKFVNNSKRDKTPITYPYTVLDNDQTKGLYLLHYDDDTIGSSNDTNLRQLRGTIVDIKSGIICSSFGYTPAVICDTITPDDKGNVSFKDIDGHFHKFAVQDAVFQCLYDGCLIRVWKHNGKVYHSTHRRLDAVNSFWGNSDTFISLYYKYGGPDDEELFDPEKPYSSLCHVFLIVDQQLMTSSKLPLGDAEGFLLYFGALPQYYVPGSPDENTLDLPVATYPISEVECDTTKSSWCNGDHFVSIEATLGSNPIVALDLLEEGKIQIPSQFDFKMANQVLSCGFQPTRTQDTKDIRFRTGEAVLCRYINDKGVECMVQFHSNSYNWRKTINSDQPNLLHRAYEILSESYFPRTDEKDTYTSNFPIIGTPTSEQFNVMSERAAKYDYIYFPPEELLSEVEPFDLLDRRNKESRIYRYANAMLCYALSTPLVRQSIIFNLYNKVLTDRQLFITFMCQNSKAIRAGKFTNEVLERFIPSWNRMAAIVELSRTYANNSINNGANMNFKVLMNDNIRNFIMKENGTSLYRLVAAYNSYMINKNSRQEN